MIRRLVFGTSGMGQKASQTHRAIASMFRNRPVWTPVNYANLAREGYKANVYVHAAVSQVTRAAKGIPVVVYQQKHGGKKQRLEYGEGGPGAQALMDLLTRPNPKQGWGAFVEAVWGFRRIAGNSYIEELAPSTGPRRGMPLELWPLRPDRMRVKGGVGPTELIHGYEYRIGGAEPICFEPHEILHWKFFDPTDDFYGLSPIAVAARSIDQSNESARWNVALLKNGAAPSGMFSTPLDLGDDFEEFRDELIDAYTGADNAGAPIVADNDLDWKNIGLSPVDMMWIDGRRMSAAEIALSQGVAPELAGSMEKKYSNYGEARKALMIETVLPEWDDFRDELNHWLVPRYGDGLYLDYDRDEIEVLREDRNQLYTSVALAVKEGIMTRRQGAGELGLDSEDLGPESDVLTVSGGTVPLAAIASLAEPRKPAAGDDTEKPKKPSGDKPAGGTDTGQPDAPDGSEDGNSSTKKAVNLFTPEAKELYWRGVELHRESYVGTIQLMVQKRFHLERAALVKAAEGGNDARSAVGRVLAELGQSEHTKAWRTLITATWFAVGEDFAKRTFGSLVPEKSGAGPLQVKVTEDAASAAWRRTISTTLQQNLDERVGDGRGPQGVTGTTLEELTVHLQEGIAAGEGIDQIAKRVDQLYLDSIIPHRSEVIARTEVISASNLGTRAGALSTGLPLRKTWIGTFDSRIRDSHQTAATTYNDDGAIGLNDPYLVGGSSLMYPGDPSGAAKEVIQCRCVEGYLTT